MNPYLILTRPAKHLLLPFLWVGLAIAYTGVIIGALFADIYVTGKDRLERIERADTRGKPGP